MQSFQGELDNIIQQLQQEEVQAIASSVLHIRQRAINSLMMQVPEQFRNEAMQIMPVKFLESRTYEGVVAGVSWLMNIILDGHVDDGVIENVYEGAKIEYLHADMSTDDRDKQKDARSLKLRIKKIRDILIQKRPKDSKHPSALYIDFIAARYQYDFAHDTQKAIVLFESLCDREYEPAVALLGMLYEETGLFEKAGTLYNYWANKTGNTDYYKSLIRTQRKLGKSKEAYDLYVHYVNIATGKDEDKAPFVLLKGSVDSLDDLEEMAIIGLNILGDHEFSPEYVELLQSARDFIDRELRKILVELNYRALSREESEIQYVDPVYDPSHMRESFSGSPLGPENHSLWMQVLFLHSMNALILFDNSKLRTFEVWGIDGDIVISKEGKEKIALLPKDDEGLDIKREAVENFGKVEEYIEILHSLYCTEEGKVILREFFHQYPFSWVGKFLSNLENSYNTTGGDDELSDKTQGVSHTPFQGDTLHFAARFAQKNPIIVVRDKKTPPQNTDDIPMNFFVGGLPSTLKIEDFLDDIMAYMHRIYIHPEYKKVQIAILALRDEVEISLGDPEYSRTGKEHIIPLGFQVVLEGMGSEFRDIYTEIGTLITDKYGETVRQSLTFLALDPIQIGDKTPEFIKNDFYLAWYFLMTHLLVSPEPDDDIIKNLLSDSIFYVDYLEDSDNLNSILCSTLVSVSHYDFACELMLRTGLVFFPAQLALFLSCLTYLDEDMQKGFLEDLQDEARGEEVDKESDSKDEEVEASDAKDDTLPTIGEIIRNAEKNIDPKDEYAKDDQVKCDLAKLYLAIIEGRGVEAENILDQWSGDMLSGLSPETSSEIRFARVRLKIESSLEADSDEFYKELSEIFPLLSYEHKTECMVYLLRMTFSEGRRNQFMKWHALAIEKLLPVGLWEFAPGLIGGTEEEKREMISNFCRSNLAFLPSEARGRLIDICLTYRYSQDAVSEYGNVALQAAFLLSKLPIKEGGIIDSQYQYSMWLNNFLAAKTQYTEDDMEVIGDFFEESFGYSCSFLEDDESYDAISSVDRLSAYLMEHIREIIKRVELLKAEHKTSYPDRALPEDFDRLWLESLKNYIEILQRVPHPKIEQLIIYIGEKFGLEGESFPGYPEDKGIFLKSAHIH